MGWARYDLINALARQIGGRRYLEIGVQDGNCFRAVEVAEKVGVDPAGYAKTIAATSDHYFAHLDPGERFDLVFVDGLHERTQVARDVLNARRHLSPGGAIVVHDCLPPNEAAGSANPCPGIWCGDVWRGWMDLRHVIGESAYMAVVDTDLGCGVVLPAKAHPVGARPVPWDRAFTDRAEWEFFHKNREPWLNLISVDAFLAAVRNLSKVDHQ